jgi:hypothetical protein
MLFSVESAIFSKPQGVAAGLVGSADSLSRRESQNGPDKGKVNAVFILLAIPVRVLHFFQILLGGHDV